MVANANEEDDFDNSPAFIDMNSVVEVDVPETNTNDAGDHMMMDDADEDGLSSKMPATEEGGASSPFSPTIVDQSKATFNPHTDAIYAVASHYDAASHRLYVASGGGDDRAFLHHVTTTSNAELSQTTTPLLHPHTDSVSCVSFNAPYIASDVSGTPQKNLLAVGSYDGAIVLYDADSGDLVQVLEGPSDVEWACFHPKGGTVLLAGSIADGTIWMYHTPSKSCLQVFVGHEGGVTAGAFTPDGKWAVSAGQDGTCRVWNPKKGMSRHVFRLMGTPGGGGGGDGQPPTPGLTCLAVGGGQDGQLAICGGEDGNGYVVHIAGKKLVATLPHFDEAPHGAVQNADAVMAESEARSVEAVGFCPPTTPGTANWCATGGVDGVLKLWCTDGALGGGPAQPRGRCVREGRPGITRLAWHAAQPLVICGYTDGAVGIWDARAGGTLVGTLTGHGDMINDMSVATVAGGSGAAVVVTGSDDKMVKMFEYIP